MVSPLNITITSLTYKFRIKMITQQKSNTLSIFPKKQSRFQMSYKKKEVELFSNMEKSLMEDLGIPTRCDLHKYCIRTVHNLRTAAALNI